MNVTTDTASQDRPAGLGGVSLAAMFPSKIVRKIIGGKTVLVREAALASGATEDVILEVLEEQPEEKKSARRRSSPEEERKVIEAAAKRKGSALLPKATFAVMAKPTSARAHAAPRALSTARPAPYPRPRQQSSRP